MKSDYDQQLAFERCIDLLVRLILKYGGRVSLPDEESDSTRSSFTDLP